MRKDLNIKGKSLRRIVLVGLSLCLAFPSLATAQAPRGATGLVNALGTVASGIYVAGGAVKSLAGSAFTKAASYLPGASTFTGAAATAAGQVAGGAAADAAKTAAGVGGFVILQQIAPGLLIQILGTIVSFLLSFFAYILFVGSQLFDYTIAVSILSFSDIVSKQGAVMGIWRVVRDLANMSLIFMLLYASAGLVLQNLQINSREVVKRVILVAIFINFSAFFAKVVIDPSNILAGEFYSVIQNSYKATSNTEFLALRNLATGEYPGIAGIIVRNIKVQTIFDPGAIERLSQSTGDNRGPTLYKVVIQALFGIGFLATTSLVLFAGSVFFLIRIVSLTFLVALSPLAFAAYISPKTESFAAKWWKELFNQAFFAPAYTFFMYLSLRILTDGQGIRAAVTTSDESAILLGFTTGDAGEVVYFCIVISFMFASLAVAHSFGAKGSGLAMSFGSKATSWLGSGAGNLLSPVYNSTIGGFTKSASRTAARLADVAANTPYVGTVARPILKNVAVPLASGVSAQLSQITDPSKVFGTASRIAQVVGREADVGNFTILPTREDRDQALEKSRKEIAKEVAKAKSVDDIALTFGLLSEDEQIEVLKNMSAREQALFFDKFKKYRHLEGVLSTKQSADNEEKYQEAKKKRAEEGVESEARKVTATGAPDPVLFAKLGTPKDKNNPGGQYKELEKNFAGFSEKEIEAEMAKRDEFQKKVYEKLSPANRAKLSDKIEEEILLQTQNLNKITNEAEKTIAQGKIDELKTLLERVSEMKASLGLDDRKATTNAEERLVKDRVVGEQIRDLEKTAQAGNLEILKVRSILEQIARVDNSYVKSIRSEVRYNPVVIEAMNPKMAASAYQGARAEQQKIMASVAAQNPESGIAAYLNGNPLKQAKNRSEPKQQEQSQPEESGPVADTRKTYL